MTLTVIRKFDCEDCDKSVRVEQTESTMFLTEQDELDTVGWHLEISEQDDNTQLFLHYCHKCWLERSILGLGKRLEEVQAEYSKLLLEEE